MELLGIDPKDTTTGVAAQTPTHFYRVTIEIEGVAGSFRLYAGFPTEGTLSEMNVGFLGYWGFFDRLFVILDGVARCFWDRGLISWPLNQRTRTSADGYDPQVGTS
jgi:hypothetical protein